MGISEERWARIIEDVKRVSEANNARNHITYNVFEIILSVNNYGYDSYKWRYLQGDIWIESKDDYSSKGDCLANFLTDMTHVSIDW